MDKMNIGNFLTSISIMIALITFIFGYYQRRNAERRRQTLDFLLAIMESTGPIHNAQIEIASWIATERVFENDKVDVGEDKIIIEMIDFYDLIAASAMHGIVDKEMIILHLGGRMRSTYSMVKNYIKSRRETLKRPGLYESFEQFVTKQIKDRKV